LRASIGDQIEARLEQGEPEDIAERAVLTGLGDPDRLAAGYTERPLWLIGPRYYLTWWRLTKLLWAIVPACAAFGVALARTIQGADIGEIIGSVASVAVSVIVHVGFWTTLVFFIVERNERGTAAALVRDWTPDDLPAARERRASFGDLIATMFFLVLAAGAVLWDQVVGFVYTVETGWIPFLHPALGPWYIGGLLLLIGIEMLFAVAVYARGRWDVGSATVNLVLNVVVAGSALWLLAEERLLNPEFIAIISANVPGTVGVILTIVFGFGVSAVAAWDSVDGYLKAYRQR
jgi:hypothetical protein